MGDDEPVAIAERPEFLAMGRGRRADRIEAAAPLVAAVHGRTGPFVKLIREAATTDEEFAELLRATCGASAPTSRPASSSSSDDTRPMTSATAPGRS